MRPTPGAWLSQRDELRFSLNRQAGSMTQKDGSPEASEGPYWSEELLAVLVVGLGDETQARDTRRTPLTRQADPPYSKGGPPLLERRTPLT